MSQDIYANKPLSFHGQIPIFSVTNDYIVNYEKISKDHIDSLRDNGTNPFIPEDLWVQLEGSTSALIKKYSKPGDKILDVGVGLGRLLSEFPELKRYGVDISLGYLDEAYAKGIDVCCALVEDLPYKEELFDIIICTDVLEHVFDLNAACKKILAALRPGGTLIVRVPYREDLSLYTALDYPYEYVHLRNFDEHSLRLLFEKIFGMKICEMVTAGNFPDGRWLKLQVPFPKRDGILVRLFKAIRVISPGMCHGLIRCLYNPIEINVVIRK
jgi:SAM-dependent methyltransferase